MGVEVVAVPSSTGSPANSASLALAAGAAAGKALDGHPVGRVAVGTDDDH
ncbi:MAG: hypothetical protein V9E86_10450 [Nitrosomonas sp.]